MRALPFIVAALLSLTSLAGCDLEEPRTPYEARSQGAYALPAARDDQAQARAQQATDEKPAPLWPRVFASGDTSIATYEPKILAWKDDRLTGRAAVELYPAMATTPKYGFVWFEAPTRTDREHDLVTLGDVRVARVHFPTAPEHEAEYLDALRGADLVESKAVTIDRLQQQLAYGATGDPVPSQPVKNDPPAIVVSDRPEMIVQVDGPPRFTDDGGVQRVVNTRALILSDRGSFYLWVGDRWFAARSIEGPYTEVRDVPPALEAARGRLASAQAVDLFGEAAERVRQGMKIVVATKPTVLIETRGAPAYDRISGTTLSSVSNTDADVLRDDSTNQTYVLLEGRWYRAPSLGGPWTFVAARDLPPSFRTIPRDHREARVLASVPSTPEAEEAAIAASIPQTATVDRGRMSLAVKYDGDPDFEPVEGASAPLKYAINSETPVIAANDGFYYAVENGVWFVATSPTGPWTVATSVPESIYSIPVSSPIHYVTYVRVYGYSPDYVYVGYTPGYLGAFYTGGVVVLGAGYPYAYGPWFGRAWYGGPRYSYGAPWGYYRGPAYYAGTNVYRRWSPSVVYAPPAAAPRAPRFAPAAPRVGAGSGFPGTASGPRVG
ncbi:MAG: toxin, partial [Labilithrix sp.]|nr:toxin [Labilithrix sp.]